jgi:hypothetical protein
MNHTDSTQQTIDPALYPALLEALESKPHPSIPTDFAARMAQRARTEPVPRPRTRTHYGQTAAWLSLIVLTAVVVALAPTTISTGALTITPLAAVEYVLLAQLLALALWLGTRTFPGTR